MKIHHLSLAQAYATMKSGPDGLTSAEAERRLKEYGTNELQRLEQQPAVLMFLREFGHFFALILWLGGQEHLLLAAHIVLKRMEEFHKAAVEHLHRERAKARSAT